MNYCRSEKPQAPSNNNQVSDSVSDGSAYPTYSDTKRLIRNAISRYNKGQISLPFAYSILIIQNDLSKTTLNKLYPFLDKR